VEAILRHLGHHGWDFRHLVTIGLRIFAYQLLTTATAYLWFDIMHALDLLDRHQFPGGAFVSWLCTALASTLGSLAWLSGNPRPITGWGQ